MSSVATSSSSAYSLPFSECSIVPSIASVRFACPDDHVRARRRVRVLEVRHEPLRARVQRVDDHLARRRPGDLHAPVQVGRMRVARPSSRPRGPPWSPRGSRACRPWRSRPDAPARLRRSRSRSRLNVRCRSATRASASGSGRARRPAQLTVQRHAARRGRAHDAVRLLSVMDAASTSIGWRMRSGSPCSVATG